MKFCELKMFVFQIILIQPFYDEKTIKANKFPKVFKQLQLMVLSTGS